MARLITRLTQAAITAAFGLAAVAPVAATEPPPGFVDSFTVAAGYHRQLSLLPARYPDQPETADVEFRRLTAEALELQQQVEVHPCFAKWWAHELMGLELVSLSHRLRDHPSSQNAEADALERLGSRMWAKAMALVPAAGEACGAAPLSPALTLSLPLRSGAAAAEEE